MPVKVPRVRDRKPGEGKITFTPSILPRYLRKAKSVEELLPWLYLNPRYSPTVILAAGKLRWRHARRSRRSHVAGWVADEGVWRSFAGLRGSLRASRSAIR